MCRMLLASFFIFSSCVSGVVVEKQISLMKDTNASISSYIHWRKIVIPAVESSCERVYSMGESRLFDVIDLQHQQIQNLVQSILGVKIVDRTMDVLTK